MLNWISLRRWYLLVAVSCGALLGYALYSQHQMFLDPCPLCVFQRVAFMWMGVWALIAAVHNPKGIGRWVYAVLVALGAGVGSWIAGRHIWLQNLPPDQVPECGPGLSYMMDTLPFMDVLRTVLTGDGSCAEVQWTFLGLSMPGWTLVWYIGLGLFTLMLTLIITRRSRTSL